tara:strand:+ start:489 stop:1145 length:657 start_codon:yes stop_codon:yes gene_type:complete
MRKFTKEHKKKLSLVAKKRIGEKNSFYGRHHTKETKRKISFANKGRIRKLPAWNKNKKMMTITKKKISDSMRKLRRQKPELWRNQILAIKGGRFTKEHKEKISIKIKEYYKDNPSFNRGTNNGRWNGGSSFEPYSPEFNLELKERVRKKYDYRCFITDEKEKGHKLYIHHIDYNKQNNRLINLVPLSHKLHLKTNSNRDYWFAFFCYHLNKEPEELLC